MTTIRNRVPFYDKDRTFTPDIEAIKSMILNGDFWQFTGHLLSIYREER
jgi:histidine ammonia-lyase